MGLQSVCGTLRHVVVIGTLDSRRFKPGLAIQIAGRLAPDQLLTGTATGEKPPVGMPIALPGRQWRQTRIDEFFDRKP